MATDLSAMCDRGDQGKRAWIGSSVNPVSTSNLLAILLLFRCHVLVQLRHNVGRDMNCRLVRDEHGRRGQASRRL